LIDVKIVRADLNSKAVGAARSQAALPLSP